MSYFLYSVCFFSLIILGCSVVFLIKRKLISEKFSYPFLFSLSFISIFILFLTKPTFELLGIKSINSFDFIFYLILTLVSLITIYLINKFILHQHPIELKEVLDNKASKFLLFYILISSPVQEFFFRSFVYFSLDYLKILNFFTMVSISWILFIIAHLAFRDRNLKIGVVFMGLIWGIAYYYSQNLVLISVSHAIIGLCSWTQGLITTKTFFQKG